MELYFRHHPSCCLPARGLVEKTFVPDHGLVARSSYGTRQQLRDVALRLSLAGMRMAYFAPPLADEFTQPQAFIQCSHQQPGRYQTLLAILGNQLSKRG
jgi:hypothetical protein